MKKLLAGAFAALMVAFVLSGCSASADKYTVIQTDYTSYIEYDIVYYRHDSTYKDNVIYVHVWDWKENEYTTPEIPAGIVSVSSLTASDLSCSVSDGRVTFSVSPADRLQPDTIIKIELDRPVEEFVEAEPSSFWTE